MNKADRHYFNLLTRKIEKAFSDHNSVSSPIEEWKGSEIVAFQEDLFDKVNGRISEKWFYSYIKNPPQKLPRIDVLNLLSNYVGFNNWNDFKAEHKTKITVKSANYFSWFWIIILIPLGFFIYRLNSKNNFEFCFVDAIKNEYVTNVKLDIKILQENESPIHLTTDSLGCFSYKSKSDVVKFVVQSPYHKTDTIVRNINSNYSQTVKVISDDYSLMLHYYANGNIKDWKNHVEGLKSLLSNEVKIYRFYNDDIGVEVYSKDEFINLLTIPTKSLRRIEILDKKIHDDKIVTLKFIVK